MSAKSRGVQQVCDKQQISTHTLGRLQIAQAVFPALPPWCICLAASTRASWKLDHGFQASLFTQAVFLTACWSHRVAEMQRVWESVMMQ